MPPVLPAASKKPIDNVSEPGGAAFASTLARGLEVLTAFTPERLVLANSELAAITGLTRPTVARLTSTLVQLGYLRRLPNASYVLTPHLLSVAYPVLARLKIRGVARPLMLEFASSIQGTVSIGTIDGTRQLYVESTRSIDHANFIPDVGVSTPLISTAIGRALISTLGENERHALYERIQLEMPALWVEMKERLFQGVEHVREHGYCLSYGDQHANVHAAAVPLLTTDQGEPLALNCGIPVYRLSPSQLQDDIAPRLVALAGVIRRMVERNA